MVSNRIDCHVGLPFIAEEQLIYFVTYCQKTLKLKHDTIKLYLAGIRYFHIRSHGCDPIESSARLPYIMRGIKKSQSNITKTRLPITYSILRELCNLLSLGVYSPFIDLMLQCVFNMAFFGFLRCGEFTCQKNSKDRHIVIQDISIDSSNKWFKINLRFSKCDPFGQGVTITIYENNGLKPVDTMKKYLSMRALAGTLQSSPLFLDNEFTSDPLERDTLISFLRHLLGMLGYESKNYSGHSFRKGAATSAAAAGVEDHVIRTLGRWSSDCYIRYISTDVNVLQKAQTDMCRE